MRLSIRQPDGATLRDHLLAVERMTGKRDEALDVDLPRGGEELASVFIDLHHSRPAGMGASAITQTELAAWQANHGLRLTPWEVDTLCSMDRAALAVLADDQRQRMQRSPGKP